MLSRGAVHGADGWLTNRGLIEPHRGGEIERLGDGGNINPNKLVHPSKYVGPVSTSTYIVRKGRENTSLNFGSQKAGRSSPRFWGVRRLNEADAGVLSASATTMRSSS